MKLQSRSVALLGLTLVSIAAVSFVRDVNGVAMVAHSGSSAETRSSAETSATTSNLPAPVLPVGNPCPRFNAGSLVRNPPALFSSNGFLRVRFSYQHRIDHDGTELLCFMTPDGLQDPTLHVKPGDHLVITITNNTPSTPAIMPPLDSPNCGDSQATKSSINIHYHGTNTSPACHQDDVIKTIINPGETFLYNVAFPTNEPSGLYWYHPHVHMLAEHSVQGGATGAIVVDGIENLQPAVSGLRQRVLMIRDQLVPGHPVARGNIPSFDLTLNYIPIASPTDPNSNNFVPAVLRMQPGTKEFWRVSNSSADVPLDLQYVFDGVPQTLQLVAIDGVPLNSQEGARPGSLTKVTHFTLPNASRVEFIVSAPPSSVQVAQLITRGITAGFGIFNDPRRPLATVQLTSDDDDLTVVHDSDVGIDNKVGTFTAMSTTQNRFAGLASAPVAMKRTVFFDENVSVTPPEFFMGVQGLPEHVFDPNAPPDIVATQGTVEEWTVENRTLENHAFHIHQIHFLVESQNNFELNGSPQVSADNGQYLDTIQVPFWDQNPNHPFPSVTLRIDFRGNDIGDFVFHCHILSHEDLGMMNIVRVRPSPGSEGRNRD
jgi:FtsP/CotA-like multicopper oxidase with cupredoxin domain